VNSQRAPDRSCVLVTHYQRLLEYVVPDYVHVLVRGRIARSGDRTLALELERRGYDFIARQAAWAPRNHEPRDPPHRPGGRGQRAAAAARPGRRPGAAARPRGPPAPT